MEKVIKTKKGIFIQAHDNFGAIVFSPFSGLFFAIKEDYISCAIDYCNNISTNIPVEIENHLNIGCKNETAPNFDIKHYLPSNEVFLESNAIPHVPIVINWLISNKCNCNCSYCYAGDVIDKDFEKRNINDTALDILKLNPLVVVISGGEPLMEKQKMIVALQILGDKVGIIVDTNGLIWDNDLIKLFVKYKVVVRVSLDSLHGETNSRIRPTRDKKLNKTSLSVIANNIINYRQFNVPVLIHSVITNTNKNSIDDLYNKLPSLGVNGWRILFVIKPNDSEKQDSFDDVMNFRNKDSLKKQQLDIKNKITKYLGKLISKSKFSIQIIPSGENDKNSVILVLPDGKFATELIHISRKTEIKSTSLFKEVDLVRHYERYLGKI
jgi:MoaA/NifB/PqqE/SkfB family radical SAM enzyme